MVEITTSSGTTFFLPGHEEFLRFPDELPPKKKVAKWAYSMGIHGLVIRDSSVRFSDEMTEEEATLKYGYGIRMLPGTEKEI